MTGDVAAADGGEGVAGAEEQQDGQPAEAGLRHDSAERVPGHVQARGPGDDAGDHVDAAEDPMQRTAAHEQASMKLKGTEEQSDRARERVRVNAPRPGQKRLLERRRKELLPEDEVADGVERDRNRENGDETPRDTLHCVAFSSSRFASAFGRIA
jgi:hypothetical protein